MTQTVNRLQAADLPDLLGVPLSAEQLQAATAPPGPSLIVAGAGSGKTTVMAARVVWLVGTGQVSCAGVLGLTFTNKAAAELLHRVRGALRRLGPAAAAAADDAIVSTYHSFAGVLLREFGVLIGVEPQAQLMSSVRQRQVAYRIAVAGPVDPRHATSPRDLADAVLAMDSLLADNDVALEDLAAFDDDVVRALSGQHALQRIGERMLATAQARRQLARLVGSYRQAKVDQELLDFADYVRLGAQAARRHPQIGQLLRQRHQAVLLDEFQDTSVAQSAMLQALFGGGHPVTAVGDPCQAIYGWRGASPANMDTFCQQFPSAESVPAAVYSLATNRRSGAAILSLANVVAQPLRTVHTGVVDLQPDPRNGAGAVRCALLPTAAGEMDWMVGEVAGCGRDWRDIAVLARTNDSAAAAIKALRAAGIPVQVHGRQALLALPEVRWVVWALSLAADPSANDALVGLLMGPPWRIGMRDMAVLARRAADLHAAGQPPAEPGTPAADLLASLAGDPLDEVCLLDALFDPGSGERYAYSGQARRRFAAAASMVRRWQRAAGGDVADLVRSIAVDSGLAVELALGPQGSAPGRPGDDAALVALIDLSRRFDDADSGRTVHDFLRWLQIADSIPDGPEAPSPPQTDAVTVMTVHASKGLEFPVVVLPGLVEGSFPSDRGRSTWPTSATAIPFALLADPSAEQLAQFPSDPSQPRASEHQTFNAACRAADRLEETRLAYVAATRARQLLVMSGHRWGRTQVKPRQPSPYLLAAAEAARSDSGVVLDIWALPPDEGQQNPALAAAEPPQSRQAPAQVDWATLARRVREEASGRQRAGEAVEDPVGGGGAAATLRLRLREAAVEPAVPVPDAAAAAAGWDRDLAAARAELAVRRAALEVDVPVDLSVSAWLAMTADPDGFARQLARPVPQPSGAAAAAGEAFHAWVAQREAQLPLWELEEVVELEDACEDGERAALQQAFLTSPFGPLVPIAVEHPVALSVAGRVVRGRIDAVYIIDGRHWVVDWKTGATAGANPLQLALYRAAWAAEHGLAAGDVVGCFVFVAQGRYDIYEDLPDPVGLLGRSTDGSLADAPRPTPTSRHRWGG